MRPRFRELKDGGRCYEAYAQLRGKVQCELTCGSCEASRLADVLYPPAEGRAGAWLPQDERSGREASPGGARQLDLF